MLAGSRTLAIALLTLSACHPREAGGEPSKGPASLSVAEFKTLGWLEGRWAGKEPDGHLFYEDYRFKNDSTMSTWSFADSAATVASDSGEIRLRGGRVTSGNDLVAWVVTSLDGRSVQFGPLRGARNSFTWKRAANGGWSASLHWPADGSRPAKDVVYRMEPRAR